MMKRAFITGITGQDGSYLAEYLLNKGYEVHGLIRRASTFNTHRIDHLYVDPHSPDAKLFLYYGDLIDASRLSGLLGRIRPDEVYHLGSQSHVRVSFDQPEDTAQVTGLGTVRLLEAIRQLDLNCRFYNASTSEIFGSSDSAQSEESPFRPCSPYGSSKLFSHWHVRNYRDAYGLFAVNGILFNHESPRRGETFVTRKISRAVARIEAGLDKQLWVGNINAVRDWGYAPEYVDGIWRMMQMDKPDDFVLATGRAYSVQQFLETAFAYVGLDWEKYVTFDEAYTRPTEIDFLLGDASKARAAMDWNPVVDMPKLVEIMVESDMHELTSQKYVDRPAVAGW